MLIIGFWGGSFPPFFLKKVNNWNFRLVSLKVSNVLCIFAP